MINPVDVIIVVVLAAYAVAGYRRGLFFTVVSGLGFVSGVAVALAVLPEAVGQLVPDDRARWRPVVLLVLVLVLGSTGAGLTTRLARGPGAHLRRSRARVVDSALGAAGTAALMALVLWLVSGLLRPVLPATVSDGLGRSGVLRAIDDVVPAKSSGVARALTGLDRYGFPRVFDAFDREPITDVAAPATQAPTAALQRASRSIVRVDAMALGCGRNQEGSGWIAARGLVVTNAHVVAGAEQVRVTTAQGAHRSGDVVYFDPRVDLAVISVGDLDLASLRLGDEVRHGDQAMVAGYPGGGPYTLTTARVRGVLDAVGEDIYGDGSVTREVYALRADVHPGNSGGPLLTSDGSVVGVVFARSLTDDDTGYALTLAQVRPAITTSRETTIPVGTGRCAS